MKTGFRPPVAVAEQPPVCRGVPFFGVPGQPGQQGGGDRLPPDGLACGRPAADLARGRTPWTRPRPYAARPSSSSCPDRQLPCADSPTRALIHQFRPANPKGVQDQFVTTDLNTLLTAL